MGRIGWCEGGQPTSHTPTDSLDTHRGRRYMQILAPSRTHTAPSVGGQRGAPAGLPARAAPRVRTRGSLPSSGRLEDAKWVPRSLEARQAALLDETPSRCLAGSVSSHEGAAGAGSRDCDHNSRSCSWRQYTARGAQLAGRAAKSIQSSMIHQIGVGICPERLDPAVAGRQNPRTSFEG